MSLRSILTDLISQAEIAPGVSFTQRLTNGLVVEISAAALEYMLVLWREKVYPSRTELTTVINAWPGKTPHGTAITIAEKGRYGLAAVIEREPKPTPTEES